MTPPPPPMSCQFLLYQCDMQSDCLIFYLPSYLSAHGHSLFERTGHFWGQLETQTEKDRISAYQLFFYSCGVLCKYCRWTCMLVLWRLQSTRARAPQTQPPTRRPTDREKWWKLSRSLEFSSGGAVACHFTYRPAWTQPMNAYRISCEGGWYINT